MWDFTERGKRRSRCCQLLKINPITSVMIVAIPFRLIFFSFLSFDTYFRVLNKHVNFYFCNGHVYMIILNLTSI